MICLDWEVEELAGMWRAQVSKREILLPSEAGMGYYRWPVKAPSNSHDIMAGIGAAGDKQRRVCTQRTQESSNDSQKEAERLGLEVTSVLFT